MKQRGREPGEPAAGRRSSALATPKPEPEAGAVRSQEIPRWMLGLILAAAVVLAYQPVWNAGFIWDDDVYVTANPLLTAPDGLRRIWFSTDSPSQYFPLVYTCFRIENGLWGLNPTGYHWVNILIHAANAVLLWQLLSRLKMRWAWLGA